MINDVLFQIVLFLSNTLQTITGFAGTLLAMPFSIRLVGVEQAKAVLNIFTMLACFIITIQNRKHMDKRILIRMIGGMLVGMIVGIQLFQWISLQILLKLYALLIILLALKKIFWKRAIPLPSWAMLVILLGAGIIHGMFISGGALLVVYAVSVLKDKETFRATIAPVWVILNGILCVSHYQSGYYTTETLVATGFSLIPLLLSIAAGNILYKKINQGQFLRLTYILLLIAGVSLLL